MASTSGIDRSAKQPRLAYNRGAYTDIEGRMPASLFKTRSWRRRSAALGASLTPRVVICPTVPQKTPRVVMSPVLLRKTSHPMLCVRSWKPQTTAPTRPRAKVPGGCPWSRGACGSMSSASSPRSQLGPKTAGAARKVSNVACFMIPQQTPSAPVLI